MVNSLDLEIWIENIMTNPTTLHISLEKIVFNWKQYISLCPNAEVSVVIKADAYGIGMEKVYDVLSSAGCKTFWVATLNEAKKLKKHDNKANVIVLGGISQNTYSDFIKYDITPVINSIEQLSFWAHQDKILPAWIQFDTAMNRLGISLKNVANSISILEENKCHIQGYMSHLQMAEVSDDPISAKQKNIFDNIVKQLPSAKKSLSNTAGVFLGKDYHYDVVRVGIGLYGLPCSDISDTEFQQPLSLQSPVINVSQISEGDTVGYSATFTAVEDMTIATIAIGYADGLSINLSNVANLYYHGEILPIIGRISMDTLVVDASNAPSIKEGQVVTIFDTSDDISIISGCAGIPNQCVISRLTNRVIRKYI